VPLETLHQPRKGLFDPIEIREKEQAFGSSEGSVPEGEADGKALRWYQSWVQQTENDSGM
jgi:hypothetical protein